MNSSCFIWLCYSSLILSCRPRWSGLASTSASTRFGTTLNTRLDRSKFGYEISICFTNPLVLLKLFHLGGVERNGGSDSPRVCQLFDDKVSTQCWDQVHVWVFKRTNLLQWQVFNFSKRQTSFFQTQWEKQAWSRKNGDDKAGDKEWVGGCILKFKSSKEIWQTCAISALSFSVFLFMGIVVIA